MSEVMNEAFSVCWVGGGDKRHRSVFHSRYFPELDKMRKTTH